MDSDKLLNRAINNGWIQDGFVTSQAFKPSKKDEGKLSCFDNDILDAPGTFKYFTEDLGLEAAGILATKVSECHECKLEVYSDPDGGVPHEAHVSIDFSAHGTNKQKKLASKLRDLANRRGWVFEKT